MEDKYDIIIVGAGGSGLLMAKTLGKMRRKVLLVERKVDILNLPFKTLASYMDLGEFDLSDEVIAARINKLSIYSKNVKSSSFSRMNILDKEILHKEILDSIDPSYVTIKTSVYVKDFEVDEKGRVTTIIDNKKNKYAADCFVDATGFVGLFSKKTGLLEKNPHFAIGLEYNVKYLGNPNEAHLYLGSDFKGGYGWIFPLKNQRAIIGFGFFDNRLANELKSRLDYMLTIPKIACLIEKDRNTVEGGSIPITELKSKFVYKNLICVGDSVAQVHPVVGEGYKFIFKSVKLAAEAISNALTNKDDSYLSAYENEWNEQFSSKYKYGKKLQVLLDKTSKNDPLVDLGMLFLKTKRDQTIEKLISGEFSKRELLLP